MMKRANMSGSVVKRHQKSILEQKLCQFDMALDNEGVTTDNFRIEIN